MFEKIDIGIKTFLRDEKLFHAIQGIQKNFSNARMVIVDDGDQTEEKDAIYSDLTRAGHVTDVLPFDSGFGKKSNRIAYLSTRPYLLIASDDFVFDAQAADGLAELELVLKMNPDIDIASGRVNNRPYEFFFNVGEFIDGTVRIREIPITNSGPTPWFSEADLTVNYSLVNMRSCTVMWDNDVKIGGGEHGSFFYDRWKNGTRTVYVPAANINEQPGRDSEWYRWYRNRAQSPERPCFDRRNIVEYILGSGQVDYRR